jgi:general stress protein 26
MDRAETRDKLWELIADIRFGMVTTIGPDGALRAVPLTTQNDKDDVADGVPARISYFVRHDADDVGDVGRDPRVCVVYADPGDDSWVSISGQAEVVQDLARQKKLWSKLAEAWFPGGHDDPELRLLNIHTEEAEYWDVKESTPVQLFKMAKAAVTGNPPKGMGEHQKVPLSWDDDRRALL